MSFSSVPLPTVLWICLFSPFSSVSFWSCILKLQYLVLTHLGLLHLLHRMTLLLLGSILGSWFESTPGVGDGQGGLACCNSWGCKKSDMTEWPNWTDELHWTSQVAQQLKKNPSAVQVMRVPSLGSGRSPGGENGNPLQYSCEENPMGRGAWWATVCRVAKSWTQLSTWITIYMYGFQFSSVA